MNGKLFMKIGLLMLISSFLFFGISVLVANIPESVNNFDGFNFVYFYAALGFLAIGFIGIILLGVGATLYFVKKRKNRNTQSTEV